MSLGWGQFFGGLGEVIGKVTTFIPSRIEGLKNERQRLLEEKARLVRGDANAKTSARLGWITARIATLDGLLASRASD